MKKRGVGQENWKSQQIHILFLLIQRNIINGSNSEEVIVIFFYKVIRASYVGFVSINNIESLLAPKIGGTQRGGLGQEKKKKPLASWFHAMTLFGLKLLLESKLSI